MFLYAQGTLMYIGSSKLEEFALWRHNKVFNYIDTICLITNHSQIKIYKNNKNLHL